MPTPSIPDDKTLADRRRDRVDRDLLRRVHEEGDRGARDELSERCVPLVRSIAARYRGRGQEMDDLFQVGMLGLVVAIDRFDASTGHRFVSFAVPTVQGEIRRHFRDRGWAVHVPRSMQELDAKVHRTRRDLQERSGQEATSEDVARALDLSVDDVRAAEAAGSSYRALSLDAPAGEDQTFLEVRGGNDREYGRVDDRDFVERILETLPERDERIVRWRYHDGLMQREIADRLGVSQMQVSRLLSRALDRMQRQVAG